MSVSGGGGGCMIRIVGICEEDSSDSCAYLV